MTTHLQPEPASGGFDYASMRSDIANQMRAAADRIHQLRYAAVVDIGRELIAIKERIEHGHFVEWVESECRMSIRTAQRAMKAAEMVERNDKLSYLPADGLLALSARAAKPIAEKIIGRIDAGEQPSAAEIKEQIEDAKWAVKRASQTKPLSVERREREQHRAVNEQREWGGAAAVEKYNATAAAKMLAERLESRTGEFLALAKKTDPAVITALLPPSMRTPARPFHEMLSAKALRELADLERWRLAPDERKKPARLGEFEDRRTGEVTPMPEIVAGIAATLRSEFDGCGPTVPADQPQPSPPAFSAAPVLSAPVIVDVASAPAVIGRDNAPSLTGVLIDLRSGARVVVNDGLSSDKSGDAAAMLGDRYEDTLKAPQAALDRAAHLPGSRRAT
jgi:hypothetical protein